MSVDILQEKIRKSKNPTMLELNLSVADLPPHILSGSENKSKAYISFCEEILTAMKGLIPAVRISFSSFAMLGGEGLDALRVVLRFAKEQGFYVVMDAPELFSPANAKTVAESVFADDSIFACDGLIISGYLGSDVIKPFLPYCKKNKKDIFVLVRTSNKSASELQDLLSGSRLVHAAAADYVNRYGADTAGKSGYTCVGILAAASSADSLKNLRLKYPKLFMILDGADYPNANAKNCSYAFDKFGHGAIAAVGSSVTCAWKTAESNGEDYISLAVAAAERMKKNLTRYTTVM